MKTLGIDIGSRTVKAVLLEDKKVISSFTTLNTFDFANILKRILDELEYDKVLATGYGRYLAKRDFDIDVVTEIKAFAVGVHHLEPRARTILDIGGQDTKVISLNERGDVIKFEMNDKCAAGTGRFLEIMAQAMGYKIDELGVEALKAQKKDLQISSMCTVFAESEVISLMARGEKKENIAHAVHKAIVIRVISMLKRVGIREYLVFSGGVAKNPCIRSLFEKELEISVHIPYDPQLIGAYGAAVLAGGMDGLRLTDKVRA